MGNAFISENLVSGVFFSSSACAWGLLGGLEKGEKQDSQVCGLCEAWKDGLSEATGISSPPRNPVDGRGFCPESSD